MKQDSEERAAMHDLPEVSALDLFLALRPEDRGPLPGSAGDGREERAIRRQDEALTLLLDAWRERGDAQPVPALSGAQIRAMAQLDDEAGSAATAPPPQRPAWIGPLALAASLALLASGGLWLQRAGGDAVGGDAGLKSLPTAENATRLSLQFSVERSGAVQPGARGALIGPDEALAIRLDLRGEPAWVYLFALGGEQPALIYPLSGGGLFLEPGEHPLQDGAGAPLIYRPDAPHAGVVRYLAIATSARFSGADLAGLAASVAQVGTARADLWPRPVRAADGFEVSWE